MGTNLICFIEQALYKWKFIKREDISKFLAELVIEVLKNPEEFKNSASDILNKPSIDIDGIITSILNSKDKDDAKLKILSFVLNANESEECLQNILDTYSDLYIKKR